MGVLVKRFLEKSEELSHLIEKEGWVVRPYQSSALPYFRSLPDDVQHAACNELEKYLEICAEAQAAGHAIKDARLLVNYALKYNGLYFNEDVYKILEPGDVVEFYNLNHTQIFRTFNYFEYTSYTIEDIYCRPWFTLYERDENVTQKIIEMATPVFTGENLGVVFLDVGTHLITERSSLEKLQLRNKGNWVAPLFDENDVQIGYVNVLRVEPLL